MQGHRHRRKMYRPKPGEKWLCAKCGQEIEELPFEPYRDESGNLKRPVYHKNCLPK